MAKLKADGRCVDIVDIGDDQVIHTGFGYGPEFWLLPPGLDPFDAEIDTASAQVKHGKLIVFQDQPLTHAENLTKRGTRVIQRIPRI
ncbi:MAG: hypothetical protein AAF543_02765 [Pseudomonadota bacterium]